MLIRSAGFVSQDLIGSQNALNFSYILYLRGRADKVPSHDLDKMVLYWYVMSVLTRRYAGSPETAFDLDIRQVSALGLRDYVASVMASQLPDSFWTATLPQLMNTSSSSSPYFFAYQAAQVSQGDVGFLSHITVRDLLLHKSDKHHVYPREFLKGQGLDRGQYNQIANLAVTQSDINIKIGMQDPAIYFGHIVDQCRGEKPRYGGITDLGELEENLSMNCLPLSLIRSDGLPYEEFLVERRALMAAKIQRWFESL